jgi:hypothetical protein
MDRRFVNQQRCSQPNGPMGRNALHQCALGRRERGIRGSPMQTQHAPRHGPNTEHRAQLIAEADWGEDIAVPRAALGLALRCRKQTLDGSRSAGEVDELGDIVLQEFIGQKRGSGGLGNLLDQRTGEQQGCRIDSGAKKRVDGNDLAQPAEHLRAQRTRVKTSVTETDDVLFGAACHGAVVHRFLPLVWAV